jgi:hypothetical protein
MAVPAYAVARFLPVLYGGPASRLLALVAAGVVGLATFVGLERAWRSPELDALREGFGQMLTRAAS